MKCPYCDSKTTDGHTAVHCFSCGIRWDGGITSVLAFDSTGTKSWWTKVAEGVLIVIDGQIAKEIRL